MQALTFWKRVIEDRADFLESVVGLLAEHKIQYCVIGGVAVNAYAEPMITLDLELAVAAEQMEGVERLLRDRFVVKRFPHSLNVSTAESRLRVEIQTDPGYSEFVPRAVRREILGLAFPVAAVEDVLQGIVWTAANRGPRANTDLVHIQRLLETYPHLRKRVPREILDQL